MSLTLSFSSSVIHSIDARQRRIHAERILRQGYLENAFQGILKDARYFSSACLSASSSALRSVMSADETREHRRDLRADPRDGEFDWKSEPSRRTADSSRRLSSTGASPVER